MMMGQCSYDVLTWHSERERRGEGVKTRGGRITSDCPYRTLRLPVCPASNRRHVLLDLLNDLRFTRPQSPVPFITLSVIGQVLLMLLVLQKEIKR